MDNVKKQRLNRLEIRGKCWKMRIQIREGDAEDKVIKWRTEMI